jgi:hypothetical protein
MQGTIEELLQGSILPDQGAGLLASNQRSVPAAGGTWGGGTACGSCSRRTAYRGPRIARRSPQAAGQHCLAVRCSGRPKQLCRPASAAAAQGHWMAPSMHHQVADAGSPATEQLRQEADGKHTRKNIGHMAIREKRDASSMHAADSGTTHDVAVLVHVGSTTACRFNSPRTRPLEGCLWLRCAAAPRAAPCLRLHCRFDKGLSRLLQVPLLLLPALMTRSWLRLTQSD